VTFILDYKINNFSDIASLIKVSDYVIDRDGSGKGWVCKFFYWIYLMSINQMVATESMRCLSASGYCFQSVDL